MADKYYRKIIKSIDDVKYKVKLASFVFNKN